MRRIALLAVLLVASGCSHAAKPPASPIAPVAPPPLSPSKTTGAPGPVFRDDFERDDHVPLSLRRILAEQRVEIRDVIALTVPIPDPHGRARATGEATALASELGAIESELGAAGADSKRYDHTVLRLQLLSTRVALLHEALRGAVSDQTAVQLE